jgi:hypothetical protein
MAFELLDAACESLKVSSRHWFRSKADAKVF